MWIVYTGSNVTYDLPIWVRYELIVSERMPVHLNLLNYYVIGPLQEIYVSLIIEAMNGSPLSAVLIEFQWLGINFVSISQDAGAIDLHLQVPAVDGIYNLSYTISDDEFLLSDAGFFLLGFSANEIAASQGIGIPALASSFCLSIGFVSVPILRRKYLMG
jgi:hypothetical protein